MSHDGLFGTVFTPAGNPDSDSPTISQGKSNRAVKSDFGFDSDCKTVETVETVVTVETVPPHKRKSEEPSRGYSLYSLCSLYSLQQRRT